MISRRTLSLVLMTIFTLLSVSTYANNLSSDIDAIQKMAGCYEVRFSFVETIKFNPDSPASEPYQEWGLEYVTVDKLTSTEVHLQHILLTPHGPLKHWRQEWIYSPTEVLEYKGDNLWNKIFNKGSVGAWSQYVTQVDDSPRYACIANWVHSTDGSYWECTTNTPLPRREFSKRSDYNILTRRNRHIITKWGWEHEQNNEKRLKTNIESNSSTIVAKEIGSNTYRKVDDSKCLEANIWWLDNKKIWNEIQAVWAEMIQNNEKIHLKSSVDNKTLWMSLFDLADMYAKKSEYSPLELKKDVQAVIQMYMK